MMILALSLSLMTLFAAGTVEPFKIIKAHNQQQQQQQQQQHQLGTDGPQPEPPAPFQNQGPQFSNGNQWDVRGGFREQEYSPAADYFARDQRAVAGYTSGGYYRAEPQPLRGYEQVEYSQRGFGELASSASKGGAHYQQQELRDRDREPLLAARQPPQYPAASSYAGSQQLALVLIRPLQLSAGQQQQQQQNYASPTDQYASLLLQAPAGPFGGQQRSEPLPAGLEPQLGGAGSYSGQQDKFGGVFARSHEKLSKLKSHLEKFAADAKAKLNFGSTYHYNGEETLPGPQLPPQPIAGPPQAPARPQLVAGARPPLGQQQQQLELELGDLQLSKQEQEKIRQNQSQEKLEQQQQQQEPALEQEKLTAGKQPESLGEIIPHQQPIKQQQQQTAETSAKATAASDSNEGFGRRESAALLSQQQAKTI